MDPKQLEKLVKNLQKENKDLNERLSEVEEALETFMDFLEMGLDFVKYSFADVPIPPGLSKGKNKKFENSTFDQFLQDFLPKEKNKKSQKGKIINIGSIPEEGVVYQLKITLKDSKPPIWRRLLVKGNISLGTLHEYIQDAMGWSRSHLHHFAHNRNFYGPQIEESDWGDDTLDEDTVFLQNLLTAEKQKMIYTYDFGDSWDHEILVEKTLPLDPKNTYPICLEGKRNTPPEDCGGVWGYEELLETLRDKKHPDHKEMLEWVGGPFDPEAFNLEAINMNLSRYGKAKGKKKK